MLVAARLAFILVLVLASPGCVTVKSYERGQLAHPTMQPDYAQSLAREHLRDVQEGARGGTLGVSSGCGCN
jgi:hypothetical protein